MAAATSGSKGTILVSGASGFIAAHVISDFLKAGYKVVGTVRNEQSAENIRKTELYKKYSQYYTFKIVPDIAVTGAFDDAVKGVDGVIHTQSPFVLHADDNEKDLLIPAIQGTVGILHSIKSHAPNVKRVVITSSFAAIMDLSKGTQRDYTYSEKDWNPATYDEAKASPHGGFVYCASKALAEKAANEFVEKEKPNFTITSVNPPVVYGPNLHYIPSLSKMGESPAFIYGLIDGSLLQSGVPTTGFPAIVDVRDVSIAHLLSYENPKAAGQRYFTTVGSFQNEEIAKIILEEFPQLKEKVPAPAPYTLEGVFKVDNSKVQNELGLQFHSLRETIVDAVKSLLELETSLSTR